MNPRYIQIKNIVDMVNFKDAEVRRCDETLRTSTVKGLCMAVLDMINLSGSLDQMLLCMVVSLGVLDMVA